MMSWMVDDKEVRDRRHLDAACGRWREREKESDDMMGEPARGEVVQRGVDRLRRVLRMNCALDRSLTT